MFSIFRQKKVNQKSFPQTPPQIVTEIEMGFSLRINIRYQGSYQKWLYYSMLEIRANTFYDFQARAKLNYLYKLRLCRNG